MAERATASRIGAARAPGARTPERGASGSPDEADTEGTRARILRVATSLFYQGGYRGTSMTAIADEVGISAPALYWHFSSKREICFTAIHEELRRFVYALELAMTEATPSARLGQFVRTYVLLKLEQQNWLRTPGAGQTYPQLRAALSRDQRAHLDAFQRRVLDLLRAILSEGRDSGRFAFGDLTAAAFAIVTMCEYSFSWVREDGRLTPVDVADQYRDLVLAMVGDRDGRR